MESRKSFPIDVAVSVEPNASSKCLISLAVAVVEVRICRGVYVDDAVVAEGSQTDTEFVGSDDGSVIRQREGRCANCAPRVAKEERPHLA